MRIFFKKITGLLLIGLLTINLIPSVKAANGTINARASKTTAVIGSSVTVTVTVSSSVTIGAWEFVVDYDKNKLKLTSTNNAPFIVGYGDGSRKSMSYTYTFKTLALGKANVSIKDASIIDFEVNEMGLTTSGCTINIVESVVVTLSNNNNLASLSILDYELDPPFNATTISYEIDIKELISQITIEAKAADSKATVIGDGVLNVSEGSNKFEIKVTAENGDAKIYTVTVNVIDLNPIEIEIKGKKYQVIKTGGVLESPHNFSIITIPILGQEVTAYINEVTNLILVGLKDKNGNNKLYVYDADTETYTLYNEFLSGNVVLYLFEPEDSIKIPSNFKKVTFLKDDLKIKGWQLKKGKDKDFYLLYGINMETGEEGFYLYDNHERTLQRYYQHYLLLDEKVMCFEKILIILGSLSGVLLLGIIYLLVKNKKLKKLQIKEKKMRYKN